MNGTPLLPAAIVIPLLGAALTPLVGGRNGRIAGLWAIGVASVTALISLGLVAAVSTHGPFLYRMGGYSAPWGIELRMDEFGAAAGVICVLEVLTLIFALDYVAEGFSPARVPYFYTLMLLNLAGMVGFALTGDLFNLFVFLEIISISSYALVAMSGAKLAEMAAYKYLVMGSVASLFVLLSIALLYAETGTLGMADMAERLRGPVSAFPVAVALAGIVLGFSVKSGLFPLHAWLPDAHASAPSPVSAVLSGLVVNTGVLGVIRILQIFYRSGPLRLGPINEVLTWLGAASIVFGALFAIFQEDVKVMLSYSTVSNIGYIFMGIGLGSPFALMGAVVHVFNHALIKTTLFLSAGAMLHKTGYSKLEDLHGIGKVMPLTSGVMTIGAISIVGIPPTAGFLCKWYIAVGAIQAGRPFFALVLLFGALFIFIYYIRVVNAFYFRPPTRDFAGVGEAPRTMLVPLLILAGGCLVMGVFGRLPLSFIEPAVTRMLAR